MSRYREWDLQCKVYVGNLGSSASKYEIENAFGKYGPLRNVWVARNPPGFAFVEFEDRRDAEDAARALDGTWVLFRLFNYSANGGNLEVVVDGFVIDFFLQHSRCWEIFACMEGTLLCIADFNWLVDIFRKWYCSMRVWPQFNATFSLVESSTILPETHNLMSMLISCLVCA